MLIFFILLLIISAVGFILIRKSTQEIPVITKITTGAPATSLEIAKTKTEDILSTEPTKVINVQKKVHKPRAKKSTPKRGK